MSAVCSLCRGASKSPPIEGDGPNPVCYPCVVALTRDAVEVVDARSLDKLIERLTKR